MDLSANLRSKHSERSIRFRTKHGVGRERLEKLVPVAIFWCMLSVIRKHQTSFSDCYRLEQERTKTEMSHTENEKCSVEEMLQ